MPFERGTCKVGNTCRPNATTCVGQERIDLFQHPNVTTPTLKPRQQSPRIERTHTRHTHNKARLLAQAAKTKHPNGRTTAAKLWQDVFSALSHLERVTDEVADGVLLPNHHRALHQRPADDGVPRVRAPPQENPPKRPHDALAHAHTLVELQRFG